MKIVKDLEIKKYTGFWCIIDMEKHKKGVYISMMEIQDDTENVNEICFDHLSKEICMKLDLKDIKKIRDYCNEILNCEE